ncbi:T7SS effector LXG polymorphic toxin [Streptococcus suis]|uniref:T7SS effector LXG polymorphic toxin n=2 Tax=Streptococcus suis TaxID=1307 RepID=UPI000CF5C38B|nr:T7SS effector LXG polymorphic toxin [Streptococcus suis]
MVKVNLVSMNTHISSVKAISGQRIASLQQVISSLDQFYSAGSLQGQAYTNAKDFGQDVLRSLAQGLILYSEELSQSASQLGSLYKSIVGDESLDESVLRANIASYQASLAHQSYIYNRLMGEDILNFRSLNSLHSAMSITNNSLQKEQEKLDRLLTFNSQSASVFSDLDRLKQSITSGFSEVRSSFGQHASQGGFSIPEKMAWKKDLDDRWKERTERMRDTSSPADFRKLEEREENRAKSVYQDVMQRIENGEEVTAEAVAAALSALQSLGISEVPEILLIKAKEFYNSDAGGYAISGGITTVEEWVSVFLSKLDTSLPNPTDYWTFYSTGNGYWKNYHASFNTSSYVDDLFTATGNKMLKTVTQEFECFIPRTQVKVFGVSGVSSAFMGLDFAMNLQSENVGRAAVHTAVTTVMTTTIVSGIEVGVVSVAAGSSAFSGVASLAAAGIASNPVGWAIGAGILVGFGVSIAYDQNLFGIRDISNSVGDFINDGIESIGNAFEAGIDNIQNAFGW